MQSAAADDMLSGVDTYFLRLVEVQEDGKGLQDEAAHALT
jgi:hypothetical protein